MIRHTPRLLFFVLLLTVSFSCSQNKEPLVPLEKAQSIVLIGNNLASRMMNYGYFETELHLRYPDSSLVIRNMADGGNTPGFRPHSGRNSPWAFEGAEAFQTELANRSGSIGHFKSPDEWLTDLKADVILAFFGYSESFEGPEGVENFTKELQAFTAHTLKQSYNGRTSPRLVLVSPISFEDLSDIHDLPNGVEENKNLKLYTDAIRHVADSMQVGFVDAFSFSKRLYERGQMTTDGFQLNDQGYQAFSAFLTDMVFGSSTASEGLSEKQVLSAVQDKNWFWHNYYKIPNGVHVFGRRYDPFGPDNYPYELQKLKQMIANRDTMIWSIAQGNSYDLAAADKRTQSLPEVETNFDASSYGRGGEYKYGEDAVNTIYTEEGYKVELFASEADFEELANPVQLSFDNKGRLWVAVMPSYPHYKPGDSKPNDKLLILEDTDYDGKADQLTTFADGLHLPTGFEFAPEGVYVSQGTNLVLLSDTDGDDKADKKEIILSGFDDHDTHHGISAFCADPSGAIYMAEGVFLHTNVETAYGPVRGTNGGFYRYNPQRRHLERTAQIPIPNPWGIAFDDWGQPFFLETSGPAMRWMLPGTIKPVYGFGTHKSFDLIKPEDRVRPTSGLEFVSSRHFPDEVQGDLILGNAIGFLGIRQHKISDSGTGYKADKNFDLLWSDDLNFRPVDMEFAPDGSLYVVDWHNMLVGHMQHNARDPLRDHVHGRIYRVTYPSRPLVEPAKIDDASIPELLDNLKLPEYRTRYRTRRELRSRNTEEVLSALTTWVDELDPDDENSIHNKLEAMWVTWGLNQIDKTLVKELASAPDYRARAAAVRAIRYNTNRIPEYLSLLKGAASDEHGRVRMEVIAAASWLPGDEAAQVLAEVEKLPVEEWLTPALLTAKAHIEGKSLKEKSEEEVPESLDPALKGTYLLGKEIYMRDGHCNTCHQTKGEGLKASGFPPLAGTKWVLGDTDRLIKLTLNGIMGPIEVQGETYPGNVPMTPFGGMLDDEEIASVLTYIRNSFGNKGTPVTADQVAKVREETSDKKGFYSPQELLDQHPLED